MKKFLLFLAVLSSISFVQPKTVSFEKLFDKFDVNYSFFVTDCEDLSLENVETIEIGMGKIINTKEADAHNVAKNLNGKLLGEQATFTGNIEDLDYIIKFYKVNILISDKVENIVMHYGYSPYFYKYVEIGGEKINFQIAFKDDVITIGTPIILGSY